MRSVSVTQAIPGTVHEAESCWYDTSGWWRWVDGLDHVVAASDQWPKAGSSVTWQSGPAGRGRVLESVTRYEPLGGQTVEVQDESIAARQSVAFNPVDGSVEVVLRLEYEVRRRNVFTPIVDLLFIRRAMEVSLRSTLSAFALELAARRGTA